MMKSLLSMLIITTALVGCSRTKGTKPSAVNAPAGTAPQEEQIQQQTVSPVLLSSTEAQRAYESFSSELIQNEASYSALEVGMGQEYILTEPRFQGDVECLVEASGQEIIVNKTLNSETQETEIVMYRSLTETLVENEAQVCANISLRNEVYLQKYYLVDGGLQTYLDSLVDDSRKTLFTEFLITPKAVLEDLESGILVNVKEMGSAGFAISWSSSVQISEGNQSDMKVAAFYQRGIPMVFNPVSQATDHTFNGRTRRSTRESSFIENFDVSSLSLDDLPMKGER